MCAIFYFIHTNADELKGSVKQVTEIGLINLPPSICQTQGPEI